MQTPFMCLICKNNHIITDSESGEVICSSCGTVISDRNLEISRPEWRFYNAEQENDRSRTGIPITLAKADMGLATLIGKDDRDASGHLLDGAMRNRMQRLRTWDLRTRNHTASDKNLLQAFSKLDVLKDKLALSDAVVEKIAYIYRKVQHRGLVRGRTISGLIAAAIYAGCREMETPWTLKDIAAASNVKRKDIARNYRMLLFELNLKVPNADPIKCIVKVANRANLTENTKREAIAIMKDVAKKEISAGKDPMGLAATILYLSCLRTGEETTQTQIAQASGVTEVTVRNRLKELKSKLHPNWI
ncbi:MAG TPA: TFIIB-type zinc ribbon-containing protein [Nitrososphaeraceae archaeon]|nr:TFIIB-type zinc ribbon-containing protein [Nitrososphaeraceae archaeon]